MNRLILVGNGFDLAHGLKTDYNSFILWYLKKCFTGADENGEYNDELIYVSRNRHINLPVGIPNFDIKNISDFIDNFYRDGFSEVFPNMISYKKYGTTRYSNPFNIIIKNSFFENLVLKCKDSNWVDIENEFYEQLKQILSEPKSRKVNLLTQLNLSLKFLIIELVEYLKTLDNPVLSNGYKSIFESKFNFNEIIDNSLMITDRPENSLILNFNYTSTVENYFGNRGITDKIEVNYIHGKITDTSNPIIFGFGDELDSEYNKIELEKINSFFSYIKSFWYFKTSNYHNLIRFIETKEFQVYILGHSCGLSDRTMLNMIFENNNCKSIKIFYHETSTENNFENLTQEISRHFKNKAVMRRKIVPFDKSSSMPQITK